jgi:hypothetical protein
MKIVVKRKAERVRNSGRRLIFVVLINNDDCMLNADVITEIQQPKDLPFSRIFTFSMDL